MRAAFAASRPPHASCRWWVAGQRARSRGPASVVPASQPEHGVGDLLWAGRTCVLVDGDHLRGAHVEQLGQHDDGDLDVELDRRRLRGQRRREQLGRRVDLRHGSAARARRPAARDDDVERGVVERVFLGHVVRRVVVPGLRAGRGHVLAGQNSGATPRRTPGVSSSARERHRGPRPKSLFDGVRDDRSTRGAGRRSRRRRGRALSRQRDAEARALGL